MAKGVINLQKESGGVTKITSTDGVSNTELVLPESGELVNKNYADTRDAQNVKLTGNQTIAGVKTFSLSPIVPTPTTGTQAVNKDYADLKVALASFVGTNQNLSGKGYQKLPGGLIIQWGSLGLTSTETSYSLNITYPNAHLIVIGSGGGNVIDGKIVNFAMNGNSSFKAATQDPTGEQVNWLSIGY